MLGAVAHKPYLKNVIEYRNKFIDKQISKYKLTYVNYLLDSMRCGPQADRRRGIENVIAAASGLCGGVRKPSGLPAPA